jgi:outer membrane protein
MQQQHNSPAIWKLVSGILLVLTIAFAALFFLQHKRKIAFVYNQTVFDEFEGKAVLEQKLSGVKAANKLVLDSMVALIKGGRTELMPTYQEKYQLLAAQEQHVTDQYTQDIWAFINEAIAQYGKENKYDYILGTSGTGNLMYADSTNNITPQIVTYINNKYKGHDQ